MLTINDLSVNEELDRAAMRTVLGGMSLQGLPASWFSLVNAPTIDTGSHFLAQSQSLGIDQSSNIGGLNLVISDQTQNGVAGQTTL
ncbi:hypothetical protein G3480_15705 [Thiorhodococcus mannitoliphagus]|uniref:Uncharacterized protein n=1 Tax=Thiorhodococcus mannitoliphagus TaxID=329406 RepID=A0A6P1DVK6_9GAMM|nr:hypothetical protein [Thiorhodococcus mannitoliphagus]NEX21739.1 hypothetical protein [Thiorhodococcus mannitoliphagus]